MKHKNILFLTVLMASACCLCFSGCKIGAIGQNTNSSNTPQDVAVDVEAEAANAAGKAVIWYLEGGNSTEPLGGADSVNEVLAKIKRWAPKKRAIIEITGTLKPPPGDTSRNMVSISGKGYPQIMLKGGSSGGILDADNRMRVLYISDNDVTLGAKLTLQNGNSNTENCGGGVFIFGGTLTMEGGVIQNCTSKYGGGVSTFAAGAGGQQKPRKNSTFTLSGGEIKNCTASINGGGVYIDIDDEFYLSGKAKILSNSANAIDSKGGGVYAAGLGRMTGGLIRDNSAVDGGGVYIPWAGSGAKKHGFTMDSAKAGITHNTASSGNGGGVHISASGGEFHWENGEIKDNIGSNVYAPPGSVYDGAKSRP